MKMPIVVCAEKLKKLV